MKSNLLNEKMLKIQSEYKELLVSLRNSIKYYEDATFYMVLDSINIFWFRNMKIIDLYVKNEFKEKDTYIFTASTFLDFNSNEHYPFLLLGEQHILDDPLSAYSEIFNKISENKIKKIYYNEIIKTLEDNINILENCDNKIIIIPMVFLNQIPKDFSEKVEKIFLSLFNNINTIQEFFEKCSTIDDIIYYGRKDIEKIVLFSEIDNKKLSFKERYNQLKSKDYYMIDFNKNDAYNFYSIIIGVLYQATQTITMYSEYRLTPFVRNKVVLNYILVLKNYFNDEEFILEKIYRIYVSHIVYELFDKSIISNLETRTFISKIESLNFSNTLFKEIENNGINKNNFDFNSIYSIVKICLNKFYTFINSQ